MTPTLEAELAELLPCRWHVPCPEYDGRFCAECKQRPAILAFLRRKLDEARADSELAIKRQDDYALMEVTIREQKELNDRLAFEIGGLKWEISHCRELLRHIVAIAYHGRLSNEMELALSSVNNYLDGVPQTEEES